MTVEIEDIRRLRLEPGDRLVVTVDARSRQELDVVAAEVRKALPDLEERRVLFVTPKVEFTILSEGGARL